MTKTNNFSNDGIIGKPALVDVIFSSLKEDDNVSLTKGNIALVVDSMISNIIDMLKKNKEVKILGFCSFKNVKTAERHAMNLKTGKKMTIPSKVVPKVRLSQVVKDTVSKKFLKS